MLPIEPRPLRSVGLACYVYTATPPAVIGTRLRPTFVFLFGNKSIMVNKSGFT